MDKRTFLKSMGLLSLAAVPSAYGIEDWLSKYEDLPSWKLASDEAFWEGIRGGYRLKPDYINLENGYYCFMPQETLEKYINHVREINLQGSWYMRTVQADNKKKVAAKLAEVVGAPAYEVVITRNTTESLDMVIGGLDWKPGDEAVMAEQDYGAMIEMFKQVGRRYGVVNKILSIPLHPKSDEEIVDLYAGAITAKTRLLMVCHIINVTGQILPIQKICDMAHRKGVLVMVDGAHAVGHFCFKMPDLHCDFYGSSLHKWLSTPLGAGLLWVKKENIGKVWPLIAEGDRPMDDISRLNHIGTHPAATDLTIADAIDFYHMVGPERKEARLRYLQNYWSGKVRNLAHINLNTPADAARSCGIANVGVKGMKASEVAEMLMKKYKIFTVAIDGQNVNGCRITPNIYTTPADLDVLVEALTKAGT
ncbi:MAG: aminotransferase class V-fold PLP-dependent enzyme [Bacteroidales bacterium]|jgi:selenocysteine lyase/cysteine desulfurase